ncbi:succinate dehydrogenase cytochrome b subunit [Synechococcus sp. Tobar12-5m-g]|uniref:succinate dehydrogenase cytochrome b subunit n=1 Tax=unclassified Synechococcus TaxID=2626047 RepID=UPI0020CD4118|nr:MULTISPECIES: succinate dehydrogenase cytochrome b subunit [unclassified Synechococcus]MCP9772368.1 succinate dehydrogenase cytochrome b subunit [Synechococcus sp. Tobar12-5m-g]MCP9873310.1 succinate dehydrogenase cytochrome b subunit [Synechococcus sp. Cruz CV-v-12]
MLVLFLLVHLGGVAMAVMAPIQFEAYAAHLHKATWLPLGEVSLLLVALTHTGLTLSKVWLNRQAGNSATLRSRRGDPLAAWAARSQAICGVLLLSFLVMHLAQLRWPRPPAGEELATLQAVLSHPTMLILYGAGAMAAGLHLFHGGEAAQRSLGLLTPANAWTIRRLGRSLAVLIGGGFAVVTLLLGAPAMLDVRP